MMSEIDLVLINNIKKNKMKRIIKLTEKDLSRIVKRTINEMEGFEDDIQAANDWRADNERRSRERDQERLSIQRQNNDEMFDMEMRKLERDLQSIKRSTNDPDTLNHIVDMIINVTLPRIKDFK